MFTFTAGSGAATIQVLGVPKLGSVTRSALYLELIIKDDSGAQLLQREGIGIPSFTWTIPKQGKYHIALSGKGKGDPKTPPGFSAYGSRGQYEIIVTHPAVIGESQSSACGSRMQYCLLAHVLGFRAGTVLLSCQQ